MVQIHRNNPKLLKIPKMTEAFCLLQSTFQKYLKSTKKEGKTKLLFPVLEYLVRLNKKLEGIVNVEGTKSLKALLLRRQISVYTTDVVVFCTQQQEWSVINLLLRNDCAECEDVIAVWCVNEQFTNNVGMLLPNVPLLRTDVETNVDRYEELAIHNNFTTLQAILQHYKTNKKTQNIAHLRDQLKGLEITKEMLLRLANEMTD